MNVLGQQGIIYACVVVRRDSQYVKTSDFFEHDFES
jgi:hypothetical protein